MTDTENLPALPAGWCWSSLMFLFNWSNGKGLTKKQMNTGEHQVYGGNGVNGKHDQWLCEEDSLVIGRVGAHCGNVHIAKPKSWITDNAIYSSWKSKEVNITFFYYLLSSYKLNELAGGTGQPYVSQTILNSIEIPFPPLPEQHRIVQKIEELFTDLDAGVQELEKAKVQIKSYRQAVLKAAFEGELVQTETENTKNEITNIDLPEGWKWEPAGNLIESMKNGIYKPANFYNDDGIPCLRMYNIDQSKIVWKDIKRMDLAESEVQEYLLEPGDILINRVNSRELVGKAAVIPNELEKCVFENQIAAGHPTLKGRVCFGPSADLWGS